MMTAFNQRNLLIRSCNLSTFELLTHVSFVMRLCLADVVALIRRQIELVVAS